MEEETWVGAAVVVIVGEALITVDDGAPSVGWQPCPEEPTLLCDVEGELTVVWLMLEAEQRCSVKKEVE